MIEIVESEGVVQFMLKDETGAVVRNAATTPQFAKDKDALEAIARALGVGLEELWVG